MNHDLEQFLLAWDEQYLGGLETIDLFRPEITSTWTRAQQQRLVQLFFHIRGGFAEIGPAGLTVLAETAVDLVELDAGQLAQAVTEAEEDVADASDDMLRDRAQTRLDHLRQVQTALNL